MATMVAQAQSALEVPAHYAGLWRKHRYKTMYGGRGGGKSWETARYLVVQAYSQQLRIGCFREYQNSIKDSVHKLLKDTIERLGLAPWFYITDNSIRGLLSGSEFIFKGLHHNANEIKSLEGLDKAWIEEAQLVTKESWQMLIPTIRKDGSEIITTFNPNEEEDDTYQRLVVNTPPDSWCAHVNWDSNPHFPQALELERVYCLTNDPDNYDHIWGGMPKKMGDAVIYKGKFVMEDFEAPWDARFFFGVDWGFANDPLAGLRCYKTGSAPAEELWIDYECGAAGIELENNADEIKKLPGATDWPIKADNARPETISYVKRVGGLNITPADKWQGSVEDGITHIKGFKVIHVHPRCKNALREFRLYSYKVDKNTGLTLPIIVDANNHWMDALRYALDGYIKRRGSSATWAKLGRAN
jgi:phage terminase large subunit